MTTEIVIMSPDHNMHPVEVQKIQDDKVTERHILNPGQSTTVTVWKGVKIIAQEILGFARGA